MLEIIPGHEYLVDLYDGSPDLVTSYFRFMKRVGPGYPGNEPPATNGTNCQEVLRVLIARVRYLNGQESDQYNRVVLKCLRDALWNFELRHAERRGRLESFKQRSIEWANGMMDDDRPLCVEIIATCRRCGHVFCEEHESWRAP